MWQRAAALWRRQHLVVALVACGLGAAVYALGAGGDYYADDFLNARMAHDQGLTSQWLLSNVFNHFGPGMRFADWATVRFLPFDYRITLAISVAVYVLTLLAFYRLLRALVGPSPWIPLVVLLFGLSPLWLGSVVWWAGINALVANLGVIVALDGYVRHRRDGDRGHLAQAVLGFALALLFYEKAVLLPLYAALLDLLLLTPGGLRAGLRGLLGAWRVWAGLLLVAAVFLALYLHGHYYQPGARPGVRSMLQFLGLAWGRGVVPSLVGGPLGWDWIFAGTTLGRVDPPLWLVAVGQLLVLGVLLASLLRSRSAWRGWVFVAVAFAAGVGLVGFGRITELGIDSAEDTRYLFDTTFLVWLGLAWLFLRPRAAGAGVATTPRWRAPSPALLRGAAAVATALVVLGTVASSLPLSSHWSDGPSARYMHGVRASLAGLAGTSFYDLAVPEDLVIPQLYPYSKYSTVLWLVNRSLRFNAPDAPGYVVTSTGRAVPARLQAVATASGGCSQGGVLDLRFDRDPGPGPLLLLFQAQVPDPVDIATPGTPQALRLESGQHGYAMDTIPGAALQSLQVRVSGRAPVCLSEVRLDEVAPG